MRTAANHRPPPGQATLRRTRRSLLRYAWAAPASLLGLALALPMLARGARLRRVDGVVEVAGKGDRLAAGLPTPIPIAAITFGHVVLGCDAATLARLRAHEHAHVRQYERWGLLFFPLYAAASLSAWMRGGDPYRDNAFERDACACAAQLAATPAAPAATDERPARRPVIFP